MTNDAAIGYMIMAAKELGLFPQTIIDELAIEMQFQMDVSSEQEAEEAYRKS